MTVTVRVKNYSGRAGKAIVGAVSTRLDGAARLMQARVKKKFLRSSAGGSTTSNAGQYPRYLRKHAANSVSVSRVEGKHAIQFGFKGSSKRHRMRLRWLEGGFTISPKSGKSLAIPISKAAKRHSSDAKTKGESGPRNFMGGKLELIILGKGRKKRAYLGIKSSRVRKLLGGGNHVLHYLLTRKSIRIKPRKGLSDAFLAEEKFFVNYLTK